MITDMLSSPESQHTDAGKVHLGNGIRRERVKMLPWIVIKLVVDETKVDIEVLNSFSFGIGETKEAGFRVEERVPMLERRDFGECGRR